VGYGIDAWGLPSVLSALGILSRSPFVVLLLPLSCDQCAEPVGPGSASDRRSSLTSVRSPWSSARQSRRAADSCPNSCSSGPRGVRPYVPRAEWPREPSIAPLRRGQANEHEP
jgi:hypothetical protein